MYLISMGNPVHNFVGTDYTSQLDTLDFITNYKSYQIHHYVGSKMMQEDKEIYVSRFFFSIGCPWPV